MSIDQLRAAADAFTARADRDVRYYESQGDEHPSGCESCGEDRAIAALLRTVADVHERQDGEPDDGTCTCPDLAAALVLAEVILRESA